MRVVDEPWEKNEHTIDVISFDPAIKNMGVSYCRIQFPEKICVMHALLLDIYDPFRKSDPCEKKKPKFVTPYSHVPCHELSGQFLEEAHKILEEKHGIRDADKKKKVKWRDAIGLVPVALDSIAWIQNVKNVDVVLIEDQQYDNHGMRALAHSIQTYFETKRLLNVYGDFLQIPGITGSCATVQFVSSRLKMSQKTVAAVQSLFECEKVKIDTNTYTKTKSGGVKLFRMIMGDTCPLLAGWLDAQRAEKHNVVDSILQTLAWVIHSDCPKRKLS